MNSKNTAVPCDELKENPITNAVPVREVRVAVSMVGGSSLAIYENGVAQEFFRMVHGQGLYGVLKRLTHSHAYIDILSGTSAGGINTILLSTALTVDTNFLATRETWIKLGNVDALMQDPKVGGVGSLFRGNTYYIEQIKRTFGFLSDPDQALHWEAEGEKCGVPSGMDAATKQYGDLDLFVTGTYFHAQSQTFFDARTQPIYNNNYAGVFHLKHRARRQESHFHPAMNDCATPPPAAEMPATGAPWPGAAPRSAQRSEGVRDRLAWVARTTSSLPVVFETANVNRALMNHIIELPGTTVNNYMGDGGYLNKRPLNLVLKAIAERPAHQEVVRKIFFVEPRPEELLQSAPGEPTEPNALQHAQFARNVPDWQNLSGSLEELYAHNKKVRRINEALEAARSALWQSNAQGGQPVSVSQRQLWLKIRLQELRDQLVDIWSHALGVDGFEAVSTADDPLPVHQRQRRNAEPLRELRSQLLRLLEEHCRELQQFQPPPDDSEAAAAQRQASFSLQEIDTEYFKRKAMRAIQEAYRALYPIEDGSGMCDWEALKSRAPNAAPDVVAAPLSLSQSLFSAGALENDALRSTLQCLENRLRELYHLLDLIEIINENLIVAVGSIIAAPEYQTAAASVVNPHATCQQINQDMHTLWDSLVIALRYLLQPVEGWPHKFDEEQCDRESEAQRLEREQSNAETLRKELEARTALICKTFGEADDEASKAVKAQWQAASQNASASERAMEPSDDPNPTLITTQIDNIINDLIFHSAVDMQSVLKAPATPSTSTIAPTTVDTAPATVQTASAAAWICKLVERKGDSYQTRLALTMNFEFLDAALYPIERAAELACRSYLELVQISTRDVQIGLSAKPVADKLGGDMLANLSAFLKSSWRANDILWGRLDASGAIAQTLLEPERLRRLLDPARSGQPDAAVVANMMQIVDAYILCGNVCHTFTNNASASSAPAPSVADDEIGGYLRPFYQQQRAVIADWLEGKTHGAGMQANATGFQLLLLWLLRRHQLEILLCEVPVVVAEAIAEHAQWQGRHDATEFPGFTPRPTNVEPANTEALGDAVAPSPVETPSSTESTFSAREMTVAARDEAEKLAHVSGYTPDAPVLEILRRSAREWATNLFSTGERRPDPQKVDNYFKREYAVGSETIQDIPPLVLLRRTLALGLVALHLTSNSLPPHFKTNPAGKKISQLILSPLSLLLGALYGFVTVLEQGTSAAAAMHAVAWTLFAAVIVCLLLGVHLPALFIVVAIVVIALEVLIWQLRKPQR